jgi:hypothetical protein
MHIPFQYIKSPTQTLDALPRVRWFFDFGTLLFTLIALIYELIIMQYILAGEFASYLLMHSLVVALSIFYFKFLSSKGEYPTLQGRHDRRHALMLIPALSFLGPIGALGVLCQFIHYHVYYKHSMDTAKRHAFLYPEEVVTLSKQIHDALVFDYDNSTKDYKVTPFIDVLKYGQEKDKREVLSKIAKYYTPVFTPLLRLAMDDDSTSVRVQAATIITKIKTKLFEHEKVLLDLREETPDDPLIIKELGYYCDYFAYTNLLEGNSNEALKQRAIEYYLEYSAQCPEDIEVDQMVLRLYIRTHQFELAKAWFARCQEAHRVTPDMVLWYMEHEYKHGDFSALREKKHFYTNTLSEASKRDFASIYQRVMEVW